MGDERMQGAPSDIVFELVEIEHPFLRREAEHLRTDLTISLEEVHNDKYRLCLVFQRP